MDTYAISLIDPDYRGWHPYEGWAFIEGLRAEDVWAYLNTRDLYIEGIKHQQSTRYWTTSQFVAHQMMQHIQDSKPEPGDNEFSSWLV